jgi:Arc/MetJ-type ribon-helix-helix transcriptional regulator
MASVKVAMRCAVWYDNLSYWRPNMASVKVAITLEAETLSRVDSLVSQRIFPNRSRAIQVALREKLERLQGSRLAAECAKLDPKLEQAMSEEGFEADAAAWPEY